MRNFLRPSLVLPILLLLACAGSRYKPETALRVNREARVTLEVAYATWYEQRAETITTPEQLAELDRVDARVNALFAGFNATYKAAYLAEKRAGTPLPPGSVDRAFSELVMFLAETGVDIPQGLR